MKILLIDDEEFALMLLERQLANLGYTDVSSYMHAEEALGAFDSEQSGIDVVFCDLQMPEMDGVELVRHLARLGYSGSVVLVSGEDKQILKTAAELAKAHRLNVLGALHKPVKPERLREVLARHAIEPKSRTTIDRTRNYEADDLAYAIEYGQFVNYYQPKVDMASGTISGVETLVRWRHPQDGIVGPKWFINAVEKYDLVDDLTRIVLTNAMREARIWRDAGLSLSIAVNASMDSLCRLDFPDWVANAAESEGFRLSNLVLEVTESKLMENRLAALDVLTRLRLKHIGLSIDDFGTGYSSLAQLRDVPFTELKIDQSFVHGACRDRALQAIVEASLGIARQLGMRTVAEGIEDRADWDFLRTRACDTAQGYFLAKPMPAADFIDWVEDWDTRYQSLEDTRS